MKSNEFRLYKNKHNQLMQEEDPNFNYKLFQTPKKQLVPSKQSPENVKSSCLSKMAKGKRFDLSQSPRYGINDETQGLKRQTSGYVPQSSSKKFYNAIIVKSQHRVKAEHISNQKSIDKNYFNTPPKMTVDFQNEKEEDEQQIYNKIIQKLSKGIDVQIPEPQIFINNINPKQKQSQRIHSQLFMFELNLKNSRNLIYDFDKKTVVSIYKCLGCQLIFEKASALGGHLGKCSEKEQHYKLLKQVQIKAKRQYYTNNKNKSKFEENSNELFNGQNLNNTLKKQRSRTKKKRQIFYSSSQNASPHNYNHNNNSQLLNLDAKNPTSNLNPKINVHVNSFQICAQQQIKPKNRINNNVLLLSNEEKQEKHLQRTKRVKKKSVYTQTQQKITTEKKQLNGNVMNKCAKNRRE